MRKISVALVLFMTVLVFQYCSSSKKAAKATASVTYEHDIKSVIEGSCGPCHIAGKGNKKSLDNYASASSTVDDIIARVQKNPTDHGFMPAMHPKLSDSTINLFVQWKNSGLVEK